METMVETGQKKMGKKNEAKVLFFYFLFADFAYFFLYLFSYRAALPSAVRFAAGGSSRLAHLHIVNMKRPLPLVEKRRR